ncbi:AraC family transcriptional regulator [Daejeonella sp. JGW-45]|uniref:AraC family transcriptional regulator n=1 Tax=Daejeonella sp. JGW-45 TaxID=3034148 RepID=UPI0023EAF401|nr:AraC family transcriptional regulator [Daejeonella sp. JGW-45]
MKSIQLYKDVEVTVKEINSNTSGLHKHHFFELIYVLHGSGVHNINDNHYEFSTGDVFLLTPEDAHTFEISTPTKFCIIDFTESFFSKSANRLEEKMDVSEFFKRLEYIFHNHHNVKGNLIAIEDRNIFEVLIDQLMTEKEHEQSFGNIITQNIVFLLLHLIARNIQRNIIIYSKEENPKNKVHDITAYIQQNIYDKELIKLENIATHFNKSADHLSRYFKLQTGSTIKDFITQYKLDLIKTRLKFSDLTISQIADEMNFTDESHLNKMFKGIFGQTAKQFKKEQNSDAKHI